jgi:hypothetical protein
VRRDLLASRFGARDTEAEESRHERDPVQPHAEDGGLSFFGSTWVQAASPDGVIQS